MDSKLVEEIETALRDAEYMAHCGKEIESILQRCLESLRWIPVSESLPETYKRVLVQIKHADSPAVACLDKYGNWTADTEHVECEGGWDGCVVHSDIKNEDVTHWRYITPKGEQ